MYMHITGSCLLVEMGLLNCSTNAGVIDVRKCISMTYQ